MLNRIQRGDTFICIDTHHLITEHTSDYTVNSASTKAGFTMAPGTGLGRLQTNGQTLQWIRPVVSNSCQPKTQTQRGRINTNLVQMESGDRRRFGKRVSRLIGNELIETSRQFSVRSLLALKLHWSWRVIGNKLKHKVIIINTHTHLLHTHFSCV